MLLLKIANKSFFSYNIITHKYIKYLLHNIEAIEFVKKETFSHYTQWLLLLIFTNLYSLKIKKNYFLSYIYISFFNNQKLISYILSISLSSTNTLINVNGIKGNPKFSNTSADPTLPLALRFPCLAIFTPKAADTKATAVEILNVFAPSPPVPHVSTKSKDIRSDGVVEAS